MVDSKLADPWYPDEIGYHDYDDDDLAVIPIGSLDETEDYFEINRGYLIQAFEARITACLDAGAEDRIQAISWIFEAEDLFPENPCDPLGYVHFVLGVPYDVYNDEFTEVYALCLKNRG